MNQALGFDLTENNPIVDRVFSESAFTAYIVPPPGSSYMITETGIFMQTETGNNLMITE